MCVCASSPFEDHDILNHFVVISYLNFLIFIQLLFKDLKNLKTFSVISEKSVNKQ